MKHKILKKAMHVPDFLNEPIEYNSSFSRGIRVSFGAADILFISGTASIDKKGKTYCPGNFRLQVRRAYDNLTALLKSEGAGWQDVVNTRCYLKDMRDYDKFNTFRNAFYKSRKIYPFPSSVCIEANLCRQDLLLEIEAVAIIKPSGKTKSR